MSIMILILVVLRRMIESEYFIIFPILSMSSVGNKMVTDEIKRIINLTL